MKIWNHFFFNCLKTVFAVLFLILTIYYVITYLENLLYYFKFNPTSPKNMFLYYFWQLPDLIVNILPFSVLIAGIIVHWTLARSGEVTALRSAGMSLLSISFPLICCALLYGIIHFSISEFIRPYTFQKYSQIKYQAIENKPIENIFQKTAWIKSDLGILHFSEYIEDTKTLNDPEFFLFDSEYENLKLIVRSRYAKFDSLQNNWVLPDATVINLSNTTHHTVRQVNAYDTDIHFAPPKVLKENVSSSELSFFKLKKLIESARDANLAVSDRLFDLYLKTSLPFSSLVFLLFTIPFAAQSERKESSYFNILICLSLTTTYWFGNIAFKKFAISGVLPPFIAAWSLNILFAGLALFVIAKQDKPS